MSARCGLYIAIGLVLTAIFPLLGFLAGVFIAGAAIQAHLTKTRPPLDGITMSPELRKEIRELEYKTHSQQRKQS